MALALTAMAAIVAGLVVPADAAFASSVPSPTLVSPANSTATPVKDVVLQWNAVPGASEYQVQISGNGEWTNNAITLLNNGQTVNTVFEVPVSLPHASYFWHVRAQVDGTWSSYSAAWRFLRDWDTAISIIKAPTSADPTIQWAPVSDASLYTITFVQPNGSGEVVCNTEQTSFTPYSIAVTPSDSPFPDERAFPIPEDLPDNNECFSEAALVSGADYYWSIFAYDDTTDTQVATTTGNGDLPACLGSPASPNGAPNPQLPECGGYRGVTYVSPAPFTFEAPTGAAFDSNDTATGLKTTWRPASSTTGVPCDTTTLCPLTPTFSWDPTPGANYYTVDVYLDPQHTNDFRTYTTAWPELTPRDFYLDGQAGAYYYWTVQPSLCTVNCSSSSTSADCPEGKTGTSIAGLGPITADPGPAHVDSPFQIDGTGTYTVQLTDTGGQAACVIPTAGQVIGLPTITPGVPVGGSTITFDYSPPVSGTVNFTIVNGDGTESSPTAALTVVEAGGLVQGKTSAPSTFGKQSGAVTLTSPVNGSTLHGGSVTFKWQDFLPTGGGTALEARNYDIQVSQDRNFDSTVIDDANVDLTQYSNPSNFLSDGSYFWRVVAISESGEKMTWSPTYHFTVDATAPTVSFLTKSGVGVGHQLQIQTSSRLTGVTSHSLKIVPNGKPISLAVPGTITKGATSKLFTFTPTHPLGTGVTYVLVPTPSLVDGNGSPVIVAGGGVTTSLIAKATGKGWKYSHGWHRTAVSSALSGYDYYAGAGQQASLTVGGAEAHLFGCMGPDFGKITVSIAGHAKTISEHQKFTTCGVELWHRALPDTSRKLTVSVVSGVGNIDEVQVDPIGGSAGGGAATG